MLLKRTSVLATAAALLGSVAVATAPSALADTQVAGTYNALTPTRIANTVSGTNVPRGAVAAGQTISFNARSGIGSSPSISAVDLTITAISPTRNGFLTAYSGSTRPGVASVTFTAGESVPNNTVVALGDNSTISVYNGSPGTVQIAVDRSGYWTGGDVAEDTGGAFVPVTPTRVADSRADEGGPLAVGTSRTVTPTNVPEGAEGVVINLGAVAPTSVGFLTATGLADDQTDESRTTAVTFSRGRSRVNLAYVRLDPDTGSFSVYNGSTTPLNFTADLFGYLTAGTPSAGGSIAVSTSTRTADSRSGAGPIAGASTRKIQILPSDGPTTDIIKAVVLHVTATGAAASGYLAAWNGTSPRPTTSVVNFTAGMTRTGNVIVPLADDGSISIYNASPRPVGYVVDMEGLVVAEQTDGQAINKQSIAKAFAAARTVAAKNLRQR